MSRAITVTPSLKLLLSKDFSRHRRALEAKSGEGKRVAMQVDAALFRWQQGEDPGLKHTHHGESRIPHVVKYDLKGFYRLVVYENAGNRIPLFVGDHDDTDEWCKRHAGCDFTVDRETKRITFSRVPQLEVVSDSVEAVQVTHVSSGPVLARVPKEMLEALGIAEGTLKALAMYVTFEDIEDDRFLALIESLEFPSEEARSAVFETIVQIVGGDTEGAIGTLRLAAKKADTASTEPDRFQEAVESGANTHSLVSLSELDSSELDRVLRSHSFADWMLFLHPDQRRSVSREWGGAARLLGVSGSGKTTVLVHRAVHLAKKYPGERILVLCLNPSLRRLIDHLLDLLCPEGIRANIESTTIYDVCYQAVKAVAPQRLIERHDPRSGEDLVACWRDFLEKEHARILLGPIQDALGNREDKVDPATYVLDELIWIRSGFGREERDLYLACARGGRGIPLPKMDKDSDAGASPASGGMPADSRARLLRLLGEYEEYMAAGGLLDEDGVSLEAFTIRESIPGHPHLRARCVLVDEVQDCSTVELAVIRELVTHEVDGLFLAGDPVQKVFPKQQELASAGIDIRGRGQILKQNYRNTRQILEAAFTLVKHFAEDSAIPKADILEPEFAFRDGSPPSLYECDSQDQQLDLVDSYLELYAPEELDSICVCSADPETLEHYEERCKRSGRRTVWLTGREDLVPGGIKLATLEHVKGFEFEKVFILDLSDRVLPHRGIPYEERWRDAFQIYVAMTRARDELVMAYVYNRSILLGPLQDTVTEHNATSWIG